jgi:hypothetical protein
MVLKIAYIYSLSLVYCEGVVWQAGRLFPNRMSV